MPPNSTATGPERYQEGKRICQQHSMQLLDVSHGKLNNVIKIMDEYDIPACKPSTKGNTFTEIKREQRSKRVKREQRSKRVKREQRIQEPPVSRHKGRLRDSRNNDKLIIIK